jgi:uncharacterized protein YneF (UPF0154 family)
MKWLIIILIILVWLVVGILLGMVTAMFFEKIDKDTEGHLKEYFDGIKNKGKEIEDRK